MPWGSDARITSFRLVIELGMLSSVKVIAGEFRYDASHVIVYEIEKTDAFTHFEFKEFSTEREHLREQKESDTIDRTQKILELHKQGKSYREIAQEIGLSKSMVGKILKNAAPDDKNLFTEPAKE